MGYNAAEDAMENNQMITGNFGVGIGASVGKLLGFDHAMKTGLDCTALQLNDLQVGAIIAVNAIGDVFEPNSNIPIAGIYDQVNKHRLFSEDIILNSNHVDSSPLANTTKACIITNANLNKA